VSARPASSNQTRPDTSILIDGKRVRLYLGYHSHYHGQGFRGNQGSANPFPQRKKRGERESYINGKPSTYIHSGGLLRDPNAPTQRKNSLSPNHHIQFASKMIHLPSSTVLGEVMTRCAFQNSSRTITDKTPTRRAKLKDRCVWGAVAMGCTG
jgi:hypothetical protein